MRRWFIISLLVLGTGCGFLNKQFGLEDDNIIEEITEEIIKGKTGLDLDLTPGSSE